MRIKKRGRETGTNKKFTAPFNVIIINKVMAALICFVLMQSVTLCSVII